MADIKIALSDINITEQEKRDEQVQAQKLLGGVSIVSI